MLKEKGPHRRTTDEHRDLDKPVRSGEFEYDERSRRFVDWSSYDEAQAYELADLLYTITKPVDEVVNRLPAEELEKRGHGRTPTHPLSRETWRRSS
jgi:hypothetical protein